MTVREIQGDLRRTFHDLPGICEIQSGVPEDLYIRQVWELQEAMALLTLPAEPDDLELVRYQNIGSLRLQNLLGSLPPNDPGSRRDDSQASLHGSRFRSGLRGRPRDRDLQWTRA